MAYTLIATQTLTTATASVTFSSIPGTFKDLVLETVTKSSSTTYTGMNVRFNGDTGTNYSYTAVYGDGTITGSYRASNGSVISFDQMTRSNETGSTIYTTNIFSYANTNVNKTVTNRMSGLGSSVPMATVGLWRSTAAITSVNATTSSNEFATGTTFKLWGVS